MLALDSVGTLQELLADGETDDRRLVLGYLEAKHQLARAFEVFAIEKYADPSTMIAVKELLENAMRETFTALPKKYLRVKGFGKPHEAILAYFVQRVRLDVSADELRMLTGDAVHTERRMRDLRDLGFMLESREEAGQQVYVLRDEIPNVASGAAILVGRNLRNDKSLTPNQRDGLLEDAGLRVRAIDVE
ncbi:hypothetical protein [Cryobacterium sp. M96]|uniref:hypothetical protein n=1 Tax=Cryobacterium sp. M96 TaxID=2048295 RepID=UPI000CE570C8|nr:hypothetical protein [Cryobacterium sp. M96]